MLQFGFGKVDITPRVGVELLGYGPYLNRHSTAVRDRLFARALAVSDGDNTVVLVSCDLVGVARTTSDEVKQRLLEAHGIPADNVLVHGIHTHSGPVTYPNIGWGDKDEPYLEILPVRIATACSAAVADLKPGVLRHNVVPCEGIGYDREKLGRPELADCLREDWRPESPETTDTEAHVLTVETEGQIRGFLSYFSCHPVIGSQVSRYIHGDYAGVATNLLEREHPGSIGLFLQGCEGNINSCVVHHDEQQSLLALDVIASRYARQVRPGIGEGEILHGPVRGMRRSFSFTRAPLTEAQLRAELAAREAILKAPGADDADHEVRMATVYAVAFRRALARLAAGDDGNYPCELQALRIGDLLLVGAPFEVMHRYKRRVQAEFEQPALVMSICNYMVGYAPERECYYAEGNYAASMVPYLVDETPFTADLEDEMVAAMVGMLKELAG